MHASRQRGAVWLLIFAVGLLAAAASASAQEPPDGAGPAPIEPEALLSEEEQAEATKLLAMMNAAMSGQPVPSDIAADVSLSFLKALDGQIYVPFTLKLDPATVSQSVSLYVRLAPTGMTLPPPPDPAAVPPAESVPAEPPSFPFEDVHFVDMGLTSDAYVLRRAFAAAAGSYDLYLGIKDSELVETDSIEVRRAVLKRTIAVPDLWNGDLTTSTVFVTERVEPIPAPLSLEQQRADPYAIGSARIVPRDMMQYEQTDTLSFLFFIYNPQLAENKPNVTVEYDFHRRTGAGEEFFNATSPQTLSAETLPPQFDMTLGHQLSAGQNVPLSAFPAGTYRLQIKVTDNEAVSSILRNVNFTIVGS